MSDQVETLPAVVDVDKLDTAKPIAEIFQPFEVTLAKWTAKVDSLVVTDINQHTEMRQARLARLELKEVRVNMDKTRLKLVEGLKQRTSMIDGTARVIRLKIEKLEEKLLESEQFAERHAAKEKIRLHIDREAILKPLVEGKVLILGGDLSDISVEMFEKMVSDAKLLKQAKIDAAAKAEADRKAKEEADRAERARIAAENDRLKAEAEEQAKKIETERKRMAEERAKEARAAQLERERIEAEHAEERAKMRAEQEAALAKASAERKRLEAEGAKAKAELLRKQKDEASEKARLEAERRAAAAAPDNAKLQAFADTLRKLELPMLKTLDVDLESKVEELALWVELQKEEAKV